MSYHLKVLLQTPGLLVRLFKLDKFGGKILPSAGFPRSVDLVPIEFEHNIVPRGKSTLAQGY